MFTQVHDEYVFMKIVLVVGRGSSSSSSSINLEENEIKILS